MVIVIVTNRVRKTVPQATAFVGEIFATCFLITTVAEIKKYLVLVINKFAIKRSRTLKICHKNFVIKITVDLHTS